MRAEHVLTLSAGLAGALLMGALAVLAARVGFRHDLPMPWASAAFGALAGALSTWLMLRAWRAAGRHGSRWPASRMAMLMVLHALWMLPTLSLLGMLPSLAFGTRAEADVLRNGLGTVIAVVASAVVWGVPAYALAWLGSRRFLAQDMRALEQVA